MIASCSTVLPWVGRGGEFSAIGSSTQKWQRRRPDQSVSRRREAKLVLAYVPGTHGMFATSESFLQPFILFSDTVRDFLDVLVSSEFTQMFTTTVLPRMSETDQGDWHPFLLSTYEL